MFLIKQMTDLAVLLNQKHIINCNITWLSKELRRVLWDCTDHFEDNCFHATNRTHSDNQTQPETQQTRKCIQCGDRLLTFPCSGTIFIVMFSEVVAYVFVPVTVCTCVCIGCVTQLHCRSRVAIACYTASDPRPSVQSCVFIHLFAAV